MYQRKNEKHLICGLDVTMEIIGGKWKPCLINKIHAGLIRPSDLQRAIPLASRRALNMQLKELEEHGIVSKTIYPVLPPKVEYALTEFGQCLLPITQTMESWGMEHMDRFKHLVEARRAAEAVAEEVVS
ncbi:MAG: winged helix-turn-helix transcriptional regulator [Janthinobacterium lividum]